MKNFYIVLIGLLLFNTTFGQDFTVNTRIDTLRIIQTQEIPTKEIVFEIPYGMVCINKASLVETWENELASLEIEIKNDSTNKEWQIDYYMQSESFLEFVKRQNKLYFEYNVTDYDSIPQILDLRLKTDTLFYIENQLKEIACSLLEVGEFEIQINNEKVEKVVKAKVYKRTKYSETITTEYIVNDSIYFWICPPKIHADYITDEDEVPPPE